MSSGNSSFVLEDEELTLDPDVLADIPAESVESLQADESGETKSIAHDIISQTLAGCSGLPPQALDMLKSIWMEKLKLSDDQLERELEDAYFASDNSDSEDAEEEIEVVAAGPSGSGGGAVPAAAADSDESRPLSDVVKMKKKKTSSSSSKQQLQRKRMTVLNQLDGPNDSSDDDEDLDNDDDDEDDDDDDDDGDLDGLDDEDDGEDGADEEPLGSGDDISDEDPSDLFNTANVVVCQWDKIGRARNKWKFHLKDGIMNLNGKDYVFQKAIGEAEW